jgi:hypothetical protein
MRWLMPQVHKQSKSGRGLLKYSSRMLPAAPLTMV